MVFFLENLTILIVLIPKCAQSDTFVNLNQLAYAIIYKIVAKVIANRTQIFLPTLISKSQIAFVLGRQITDNVLIVHKIHHHMRCHN